MKPSSLVQLMMMFDWGMMMAQTHLKMAQTHLKLKMAQTHLKLISKIQNGSKWLKLISKF